jgi:GNAT superfamily N-acetyltransferase
MIRPASPTDLPALRALFARANDAPYDLSVVAEEKCFGDGIAGTPTTRVYEKDGQFLGASVTCGKWLRILAVDREHRRRGIGTALLGQPTVIFAEPGNYFTPGVLATDTTTQAFFRARGFSETQSTWNLEVDLAGITGDAPRPTNKTETLDFVERQFGRIWRFEAAKAFETDPPKAFFDGAGFAVHDVSNRGLGFFGPTGVAKSMRGQGIGCRLLRASLADLRRLGYSRAVIPWTDALEFYRKCCGAEPAHRFIAFARAQPIDSAP